jgi:RNA polymerase sigma factor (sigma-70 family)
MSETPGALYLTHRSVIESVIRFVCRRRRLRGDDAEEFAAEVRLRLVESDYAILRKFEGRSSIQTFLTVVIQRLALDYQASRWGRWRPSVLARTEGPAAVRLEQLVVRDGVPVSEALTTVSREVEGADPLRLETLASRFPIRTRRQYVGEELLEEIAVQAPDAERLLVHADEEARFARVKARLAEILAELEPSERLLLQFRFEQGMKVADIARMQQTDQKRLYRRIDEVLKRLRTLLEHEGLDASTVRAMLNAMEPDAGGPEAGEPVRLYGKSHEH